jgi:hypothetical protein
MTDIFVVSLFSPTIPLNILYFTTTLKYAYCASIFHCFLLCIIHWLLQCILQYFIDVCMLSFILSSPLSTIPKNRFSLQSFIQVILSLTIPSNDTVKTSFDVSSNGSIDHSFDPSLNYSLFICCFNNSLYLSLIQLDIASLLASTSPVKLLPLPQPSLRARTDARTNPSAQRATQLRSVLARVYAVSRQNQTTTTVP